MRALAIPIRAFATRTFFWFLTANHPLMIAACAFTDTIIVRSQWRGELSLDLATLHRPSLSELLLKEKRPPESSAIIFRSLAKTQHLSTASPWNLTRGRQTGLQIPHLQRFVIKAAATARLPTGVTDTDGGVARSPAHFLEHFDREPSMVPPDAVQSRPARSLGLVLPLRRALKPLPGAAYESAHSPSIFPSICR
jgi:hypothetical protein